MKLKMFLTTTSLILIIALGLWIYYFPMQRATAVDAVNAYMKKQGISQDLIATKRVFKDTKQNGYNVWITLKNDPGMGYEYEYSKLNKNDYKHVILSGFKDDFGIGILNNDEMKYPPLN